MENDDHIEKKYFTIGEVAKRFNVPSSTIRFWESSFPWIVPKRNKSGERRYTSSVISDIVSVGILSKAGGMTVEGIQKAYKMEYLEDLKMYFVVKQRKFRPEACPVMDVKNYPYTYDESFKTK